MCDPKQLKIWSWCESGREKISSSCELKRQWNCSCVCMDDERRGCVVVLLIDSNESFVTVCGTKFLKQEKRNWLLRYMPWNNQTHKFFSFSSCMKQYQSCSMPLGKDPNGKGGGIEKDGSVSAKLRFKRKSYGRGRTPVSRQWWWVTLLYVLCIVVLSFLFGGTENEPPTRETTLFFVLGIVVSTALLISICYRKWEPPRRQWGEKK